MSLSGSARSVLISMSLKSQDFREELRVHQAANHLATKAVVDGMTLQLVHLEVPRPAEVNAQLSLAGAAVVLTDQEGPLPPPEPLHPGRGLVGGRGPRRGPGYGTGGRRKSTRDRPDQC